MQEKVKIMRCYDHNLCSIITCFKLSFYMVSMGLSTYLIHIYGLLSFRFKGRDGGVLFMSLRNCSM